MFWRITSANNRPAFRLACLIRSSFGGAEAALWGSSSSNCPVLHPIPSIWATIAFRNAQSPWSFQLRRDFTRYANRLITLSTWPKGKIGKSYAYEIRRFFLGGHIVNSLISQHFGHFRLPKMTSKLSNSGLTSGVLSVLFFSFEHPLTDSFRQRMRMFPIRDDQRRARFRESMKSRLTIAAVSSHSIHSQMGAAHSWHEKRTPLPASLLFSLACCESG